jgi:hypothetical protein
MEIYDGGQFIGTRRAMTSDKAAIAAHIEADDITKTLEKSVKSLNRETKKTMLAPIADLAS